MFSSRKSSSESKNQRLNQPLSIEKGRPPKVVTHTLYSLSFLAIGGIAWASLTDIREMTSAPGQILPIGQVNNVQHLEGGIVSEILVKEGAIVREGDALIRLTPAATAADADQIKIRSVTLQMVMERLNAQSQMRDLNLGHFKRDYPRLVEQQMALWQADETSRLKERETLNTRIRQRSQDLMTFEKEGVIALEQYKIAQEQFKIQEELVEKGYSSKKMFLEAKSAFQRSESEVIVSKGKIASARESLQESENLLAELAASVARKIADERNKASSEYAEISGQVDKQKERYDRLIIRATASGMIQEIMPKVVGEVVRPSEVIAKIVPVGQELIAEVRIDPKDIGHIKIGDRAEVKFSTYDPALYGFAVGKIDKISATTILPAVTPTPVPGQEGQMNNAPYYKAIVKLDANFIGEGKHKKHITSGMVMTADIITGSKSLTRYMLKPVARSLDKAFTER